MSVQIDEGTGTGELLAALLAAPEERKRQQGRERALIAAARTAGMTWRDIACHLGLDSPQAAQQRYKRLSELLDADDPGLSLKSGDLIRISRMDGKGATVRLAAVERHGPGKWTIETDPVDGS